MGRRRRKTLTQEEQALWEKVVRGAAPLSRSAQAASRRPPERDSRPADDPAPRAKAEPEPPAPEAKPPRRILRPEGRPAPPVAVAAYAPAIDAFNPARGLDRRTADRLKRGRRPPEARLDLHGMTAARAHRALAGFIRQSRAQGRRCVLIVTGKGGRKPVEDAPFMPERTGVLRHSVPLWLATPPLASMIVGVYPAHRTHGGDGALYVYLKKPR